MKIWLEHRQGLGEDADPLLVCTEDSRILGAFDGMGGAGGSRYMVDGVQRTGAYLASRAAKRVTQEFFESRAISMPTDLNSASAIAAELSRELDRAFGALAANLEANQPRKLGGNLIRGFPTTLSCLWVKVVDEQIRFVVFSAGDSRAFMLSPSDGLQQLSRDDLKSGADALQNLKDDSPLSNCVSSDKPAKLNVAIGGCKMPRIFFVATDGCFNFLRTPAHFEHLLIDSLSYSETEADWQNHLSHGIAKVASDDASLALAVCGWATFTEARDNFKKRGQDILDRLLNRPLS